MKKNRLTYLTLSIIAIGAIAMFFYFKYTASSTNSLQVKTAAPFTIRGFVADTTTLVEEVSRTGHLLPNEAAELSFEAAGKIIELNIQEGRFVKAGTVLAKLNNEVLLAELQTYKAKLPLALNKIKRQKALVEQDAASVESLEVLQTDYDLLQASIQTVEARIRQTVLCAPFDGVLGLRNVSVGTYVSPSTPIVQLTTVNPLKIEFTLPNKYTEAIKAVHEIKFFDETTNTTHTASIYATDAKMDENNTLAIRALYKNNENNLTPGKFVSIHLSLNKREGVIAIPTEAFTTVNGKNIVFVCNNGTVVPHEVQTGLRTANRIEILQGLSTSDTIARTGLLNLRAKMNVHVKLQD